ncbi:metalloregulator ArsR/SmtB family transcription factor [Sphingomonas sp. IC-56]|uniref:ArsR/SmtB family transcription factor n=1 Tax=Sphingomonas sp. IC-56 TaxID=2898529 RepID=UPI001E2CA8A9|nr:metalloregulator ArsR/SmtB family transcription factor [Sphingomonas sp. IC-56]MCD2323056.1 metalloregulator ArsR/SmtB family transcription factor [Sphingomonas sp. IC-56]
MSAIQLMSALAQPTRMEVFAILAKHRPGGLPVGELARLVDTPANSMSTHLAILARAGAVIATRNGRVVTYTAAPEAIRDLALFLVGECCGGCEHVSKNLVRELDSACGQ